MKDCHATGKLAPIVDKQQDWFLLDSSQKDGYTMLKMKRKLQTCDSEDMDIEEGSTFMIFAWNKEDPSNGDNNWQYHGPNRVTKTALLLDYKETDISQQANSLPPDVQTFQITPSNVKNIFLIC